MSNVVDNRVLEMRFDNAQFERGVATSMSTLDKLKAKLNLTGASKGLDNLGKAAKNVRFDGLNAGIDTVQAKFSAMQVVGVTALANITNSAITAGKRIASALTIEPVKTGFQEYETQMGAIQTILANTQKEGTNVERVNAALDELNYYADKTIYNFTEMTRNIGTFTAAGVKLDTSVNAIKGIANLAAASGSTSQQASTAMYQLSQALAAGTVKLMDWNSVVNAGMGGQLFQDALIRTSELLDTGAQAAIKAEGSFRESLSTGWLTTEVLTETLNQIAGAYSEAELIAQGYTKEQARDIVQLAETAEAAATEVKTLTQLWDTLKEAAQSGWGQTWRLIVGDFDEAKELFTGLSDALGGMISASADSRNQLLEGALSSNWDKITGKIKDAGIETDVFEDKIKEVARSSNVPIDALVQKYGSLEKVFQSGAISANILREAIKQLSGGALDLDGVFRFGDGLGEASDDVKKIQQALEDAGFTLAQFGVDGKYGSETEAAVKAFQEAKGLLADGIVGPETIAALNDASEKTNDLYDSVSNLIDGVSKLGGRELLIESFKNTWNGLKEVFDVVHGSWERVFPPASMEERQEKLYGLIDAFHSFTEGLTLSDETASKLSRTFDGLFAVLDIAKTVTGGGLTIGFKTLSKVLGAFDLDILDVTANIGDAIVSFRDWLFEQNLVARGFDSLIQRIPGAVAALKGWFDSFKSIPEVEKLISTFEKLFELFSSIGKLKLKPGTIEFDNMLDQIRETTAAIPGQMADVGRAIIDGIQNGLSGRAGEIVGTMIEIGSSIISAICDVLGIHSPSTEMRAVGEDAIEGLYNGLKAGILRIISVVKEIASKIIEIFGKIPWNNVFAGALVIGIGWLVKKIADGIDALGEVLGGLGGVLGNTEKVIKSFSKVLNGIAWDFKAKAIQKLAISLAILVGVVIALAKLNDDSGKMWEAVAMVGVLAAVLVGLAAAMELMDKTSIKIGKGGANIEGLKAGLLQISAALLLLAITLKMVADMNTEQATTGFQRLAGMAAGMLAFVAILGGISRYSGDISSFGGTLMKMSVAMLLMVGVMKLVSGMDPGDIIVGLAVMEAFVLLFAEMGVANRIAGGNATKFGGTLMKMSMAMLLMAGVIKVISGMDAGNVVIGLAVMEAFVLLFAEMAVANRIAGGNATKFGGTVLAMSASMLLLAGVIKIISAMEVADIVKGVAVMEAFVLLIAEMLVIAKLGNNTGKLAGTILAMSAAIGIMAGVAVLLGSVDTESLLKGVGAVAAIGLVLAAMVKASQGASKAVASVAVMAVALVAIAGILYLMSSLENGSTLEIAESLSLVLLSMSGAALILSKIGPLASGSVGGAAAFLAMVTGVGAVLVGIAGLVDLIPGAQEFLDGGIQVLEKIGSALGNLIGGFIGGIGEGITGSLPSMISDINRFMLGLQMTSTIASTIKPGSFDGLGDLTDAMLNISISSLIDHFTSAITGDSSVETFKTNAVQFVGAMKDISASLDDVNIDQNKISSVTKAGQMFAELNKALPRTDGIAQDLAGEQDLAGFGTSCVAFAACMTMINASVSGEDFTVNTDAISELVSAGKSFNELNKALPRTGGIAQDLAGEQDLAGFGEACKAFVTEMVKVNKAVSGDDFNIDIEKVNQLAAAGEAFNTLQEKLPKTEGLIQNFLGEKDLGDFGEKCGAFAKGMKSFADNLGDGIDEDAINSVKNAGTMLVTLQQSIPESTLLDGKVTLDDFGKTIEEFGASLASFQINVSGLNLTNIESTVSACKELVVVAKELNDTDTSDTSVDLSHLLLDVASALTTYGTEVASIDVSSVASSVSSAIRLKNLIGELAGLDTSGVEGFENVKSIGTSLSDYAAAVTGVDAGTITTSLSSAGEIRDFIASLSGLDTGGVDSFVGAVNQLGTASVDGIAESFGGATSQLSNVGASLTESIGSGMESSTGGVVSIAAGVATKIRDAISGKIGLFVTAGGKLILSLAEGIEKSAANAINSAKDVASRAATASATYRDSFVGAGFNAALGFAGGISSGAFAAVIAAQAMASAAASAARAALDEHSPSKVFYGIGAFAGEGLVNALADYMGKVYQTGANLAVSAKDGLNSAISQVYDIFSGDLHVEPTIRPVVDLSAVEAGAGAVDRMFSNRVGIRTLENLTFANVAMNRQLQNGSNADVVSAINKLGKKLNGGNTTINNINGVTYDDGSNIDEAVASIVRAARVERRR